jgi:hypothetical protein
MINYYSELVSLKIKIFIKATPENNFPLTGPDETHLIKKDMKYYRLLAKQKDNIRKEQLRNSQQKVKRKREAQ